jgi:hypothetical protein
VTILVASILNAIIARELSGPTCRKILAADGITSPYLSINSAPGIFAAASVDVSSTRKSVPEIGEASSAAKNLDQYQFLICSLVPSLPDSHPSKLALQKYRVAIFAAIAKLVATLNENPQELGEWSRHARWLVEETSEAYLQAKSGIQTHPMRHREVFDYFGAPESAVDSALRSYYGQQ